MITDLVSLLFFSRDYGHRAHLRTTSYARHMALDDFYKSLTEKVDALVEAYQGRNGLIDIPYVSSDADANTPEPVLTLHLQMLESVRYAAIPRTDAALQNIVDECVNVYLTTLYKLRYLQ